MEKTIKELLEFGILNIDKSSGPTSFNISDFIRNKLELKKTSHFGTLDPKVTGVLPVALNRACKLTSFFISHDKEYVGIMRLHEKMGLDKLQEMINKKFLGKINQVPPVKSRVKREKREREIYEFEVLEEDGKDVLFRVKCQGGTYSRKLIDDFGKELEIGAHMLELRRTDAGIFSEKDKKFSNLYDFEIAVDKYLSGEEKLLRKIITPAEEAIKKIMPALQIKKNAVAKLYTGKDLKNEDLIKQVEIKEGEKVAAFYEEKLIGIYSVINWREIFAKPEFVMQPVKQ